MKHLGQTACSSRSAITCPAGSEARPGRLPVEVVPVPLRLRRRGYTDELLMPL
jgi:hypothetical protein